MNFLFTILQNNTNYLIELEDVCYKDSRAIEGGWLFFKLNVKVDMRQKIAITGGTANGKDFFFTIFPLPPRFFTTTSCSAESSSARSWPCNAATPCSNRGTFFR